METYFDKEDVNMLIINNLTKRYGKLNACNNINLELEDGTINVLLGPNGAGKSTMMKSILGLLKYEGNITVDGFENKTSEARKIVGYIPELPALYPNLTVYEHMEFLARVYKLKDYKERIDYLIDKFDLLDKKKKFGDELSKGMQQKLNICLGLLPDPKVILLDEPMIGLDPHAIKELKGMIDEMRKMGKTLLISTHIIDSIDMIWDKAIIMQDGEIKANVTKNELDAKGQTLEELFFSVTEGINPDNMKEVLE